MRIASFAIFLITVFAVQGFAQDLPQDETGVVQFFEEHGRRISKNKDGHAVKLFSSGKPEMTVEEYQLIGKLSHLEELALNMPPMNDEQWEFLKGMKSLKKLTIWHGKQFSTLKAFTDLPIESLTVGGCMGLRDLNKAHPEKQRDAILTLKELPNLTRLNLYHSPLAPDDAHLKHIAEQFPQLTSLKLDFNAPRGQDFNINTAGLNALHTLPLSELSLESVSKLTADHFQSIAKIKTLKTLLVDARRSEIPTAGLDAFRSLRPDVEIAIAKPGEKLPPRVSKR